MARFGDIMLPFVGGDYYTQFNGTNQYVDCGVGSDLNFSKTDAFSISLWFNTTDSNRAFQTLFSRYLSNTGYILRLTQSKVYFLANDDSNPGSAGHTAFTSSTILNSNEWYHITLTKESVDAKVANFKIYINGVIEVLTTQLDTLTADITTANAIVRIGNDGFNQFFDGGIDKVIPYNKELSQAEVTTIYNYGREKGLIGIGNEVSQWEMDTLNPVDAIGANNGTSVNMDSSNIRKV